MTPEYAENNGFEDSLEKYDENMEYEPYARGEVSDYEKVNFLKYYNKDKIDELSSQAKAIIGYYMLSEDQ